MVGIWTPYHWLEVTEQDLGLVITWRWLKGQIDMKAEGSEPIILYFVEEVHENLECHEQRLPVIYDGV